MRSVCALVLLVPAVAAADDADGGAPHPDDAEVALAAELGVTGGGGATAGGMRVGGHYLYRLAERDWFDGGVAFTFGQPGAGCGRVPPDGMACEHGLTDGFAGELSLGVRRDLPGQRGFVPFARAAVFGRVLRFASDDVTGIAGGLEGGVGLRAEVRRHLAVIAGAAASVGVAHLGGGVGNAGQLAFTIAAGAELRMK